MQALLLPIGGEGYAVPIGDVREVLVAPLVTALPTAPKCARSLINVRGEVVPLFDTAMLLGLGTLEEVPYAVLVDSGRGIAAFAASGTPTLLTLTDSPNESELPGTRGRYLIDGRAVVVLDPEALLRATLAAPDAR